MKELIRIRTEINEIEASRTLETSWSFFSKTNQPNWPIFTYFNKNRDKGQISKIISKK